MNLAQNIQLDINRVERTYDTGLVRSILSNPKLFRRSGLIDLNQIDPKNQTDIIYLLAIHNNITVGFLIAHAFNNYICCQMHVNYLPKFWGIGLEKLSISAIEWIFENTDYKKIVAFAPDNYPEVKRHCELCGMKNEGYLTQSALSHDGLVNQTIMGLSK